jgi:hypothetical protein
MATNTTREHDFCNRLGINSSFAVAASVPQPAKTNNWDIYQRISRFRLRLALFALVGLLMTIYGVWDA